jgi:hypothetical protein
MSHIVLYPLKSLGYAATVDYVVAWGNANSSHSWNVVLDSGEWKRFMGFENEIGYESFFIWEYESVHTSNIVLKYNVNIKNKVFFLNVFNSGRWTPVAAALPTEENTFFSIM